MKWTQEQRDSATWQAGRIAKQIGGAVDASIELACQRNELLDALKGAEKEFAAVTREVCGNERLSGCEEFYRGYNAVVQRERARAHSALSPIRAAISKAEGK